VSELAVFVSVVVAIAAGGVVLGMLLVPRLERLTEPPDEEPGAGDDPASD
jgi:hypothetical protein